ncbi:Piso0_005548 [Millerozyma farinosa CBS 7064]|uniref:Piso0_005548 protein n=1 Tax=Pichia sorbitophila (strain ATCC MYA-4447 / BCRC 22081 / CBS 7064 / NBRC 10061 / NRRL Y-12695) TaxID=559304 RepID=G8Y298_PICSO|nr:Piso0_005548 [Millerozyma farinosa CBS 7064]
MFNKNYSQSEQEITMRTLNSLTMPQGDMESFYQEELGQYVSKYEAYSNASQFMLRWVSKKDNHEWCSNLSALVAKNNWKKHQSDIIAYMVLQ